MRRFLKKNATDATTGTEARTIAVADPALSASSAA